MPNLTLSQINSLVTGWCQGRTDYSASDLSLFANMALTEVASRMPYRSLDSFVVSSTTSGQSSITRPTGAAYVTSISNLSVAPNSKQRTLEPAMPEQVDSSATQVGMPVRYTEYRDQILLWPPADSAYSFQIRFQEVIPPLVNSTDTPALDERWHIAVAMRASAIAASQRNALELEASNQARYLGYISSTPSDMAYKQQGRPSLRFVTARNTP